MSFFDDDPPPRTPEPARLPDPWEGPPRDELGVGVPIQPVLVDEPELLVAVTDVVAFSTGLAFELDMRGRGDGREWVDRHVERDVYDPARGTYASPGRWRFGVGFGDGRRASGPNHPEPGGDEPLAIVLLDQGGDGGGDGRRNERHWLWPLPPDGDVSFVCRWPDKGIAERAVTVDSAPLRAAARRSRPLWNDARASAAPHSSEAAAWPPAGGSSETMLLVVGPDDVPEWLSPPTDTLGVPAPLELLLAHTDDAAASIRSVVVHRTGLELTLVLRQRLRRLRFATSPHQRFLSEPLADGYPPEVARLGFELADGRRATTLGPQPDLGGAGVVLRGFSGRGDELGWDERLWLGPLPPDGPLAIDFEWPAAGVEARRFAVDASALRALAP